MNPLALSLRYISLSEPTSTLSEPTSTLTGLLSDRLCTLKQIHKCEVQELNHSDKEKSPTLSPPEKFKVHLFLFGKFKVTIYKD